MPFQRRCACEGRTLDRLLQPTVMAFLVEGPQHGYALVERLKDSPLMKGAKPDETGIYRLLNTLEDQGLVTHRLTESELGPSKRVYELTDSGKDCLRQWIATLDDYQRGVRRLVAIMRKADARASSQESGEASESMNTS